MALNLDLRELVYVLSDALDLVGVDDVHHGKRVAYMAHAIGDHMGFADATLGDLLYAGLFHDCGVSSTREHRDLADSLDWDGAEAHCIRGADLVSRFGPLTHLAPIIRWHHTHATELGRADSSPHHLMLANLIYLADRVDVLTGQAGDQDILTARAGIREVVEANRDTRFMSKLVDAFLAASSSESFWLTLEPRTLTPWLQRQARRNGDTRELSVTEVRQLAEVLAVIVDAKSPFTAEHSVRVAAVADVLASAAGLNPDREALVEVAALLHDIGKLRVPDSVLDKPGSLSPEERQSIARHSFDTYQILSQIEGFEEIARWAAYHHEWVKGGGYPFGIQGGEIPIEARIVAVADIFQALRQDRPYRERLPLDKVVSLMEIMCGAGQLDNEVVGFLFHELEAAEAAATLA